MPTPGRIRRATGGRVEPALRADGSTLSSSTSRTSSASSAGAPVCQLAREDRRRAGTPTTSPTAVKLLHARGARVIGRLVAFRDPVLAAVGVDATTGGSSSSRLRPAARTRVATAASRTTSTRTCRPTTSISPSLRPSSASTTSSTTTCAGPTGRSASMVVPGLAGRPRRTRSSASSAQARRQLAPHDTFLGASVFGIAATRPDEIAQDVPAIAREVDYIAPMLYPSHWGPNEYGVANPERQPYEIVRRSLLDFDRAVRGTGARVVPWLQDFSLRRRVRRARGAGADRRHERRRHRRVPALGSDGHVRERRADEGCGAADGRHRSIVVPGIRQLVQLPRSRSPERSRAQRPRAQRARRRPRAHVPPAARRRRRRLRPHPRRVPCRAAAALPGALPAGDGVGARDREDRPPARCQPRSS